MHFRRNVLGSVWMICAAAAACAQDPSSGSSTHTPYFSFGPVGLAATETMQVNLLNTASASSSGTAASCTGTVTFTNAAGTAIGTATSYTIAGGVIDTVSLPFAKSGETGVRTEIVASVQPTSSSAPCGLLISLETYDISSGVTHVHLDGAQGGVGPVGFGH
jgi:hypothetical protein